MAAFIALLPAAGSGSRMGAATPKQYLPLLGVPLLRHTLHALSATESINQVVLVISPDDAWFDEQWRADFPKLAVLRCGGASRAETVRNGLLALANTVAADDWILVHDAARPCIQSADIETLIRELRDDPVGGLLALPMADTLKRADGEQRIAATVPRNGLWRAQTPQMFRHGLLLKALSQLADDSITDEASAIEAAGLSPKLVVGSERNIKVTFPADLALAALYLQST